LGCGGLGVIGAAAKLVRTRFFDPEVVDLEEMRGYLVTGRHLSRQKAMSGRGIGGY
jgi:hypothetical protein